MLVFEFSCWKRWTNTNENTRAPTKKAYNERKKNPQHVPILWKEKKTFAMAFCCGFVGATCAFRSLRCSLFRCVSPFKRCIIAWINTYDCTHRHSSQALRTTVDGLSRALSLSLSLSICAYSWRSIAVYYWFQQQYSPSACVHCNTHIKSLTLALSS